MATRLRVSNCLVGGKDALGTHEVLCCTWPGALVEDVVGSVHTAVGELAAGLECQWEVREDSGRAC